MEPLNSPAALLRIVVVDDNRDTADSLTLLLRAWGNQVYTAYNGRDGMALAMSTWPDAVLLDIGLPDMSGYEVAESLAAAGAMPRLLVAVSGYGQPDDIARAKAAGFHHHVLKPAQLDDLARLLTSVGG